MLRLDQRTEGILPDGRCLLSPHQVRAKGNACLTCDKFVTEETHRDELQRRLDRPEALIATRQAQLAARHGESMTQDNVSSRRGWGYEMITVRGVDVRVGARLPLSDISFHISADDRIGLVGPNGAGKTTLTRVLPGHEHPDAGRVVHGPGLLLGYFAQEHDTLDPALTVRQNLAAVATWPRSRRT
ncbi:ATP-binding cassette domain-containing protein [Streptosporangium sp. CA-135522]|uniref:ATP-binding cassette domain-containing protein n=1 Tax=Streptosporangium sp. CA-135522 TaxID=3240072 RepID=UPI003D945E47